MRSAPARSASATCSPNRAKSAARIDGAILMVFCAMFSGHEFSPFRFDAGGSEDALNGCIQQGVKLGLALLGGQAFDQRPREARNYALIPAEPVVAFFAGIATRERNHFQNLGMSYQINVEVALLR